MRFLVVSAAWLNLFMLERMQSVGRLLRRAGVSPWVAHRPVVAICLINLTVVYLFVSKHLVLFATSIATHLHRAKEM
jgi:hypothetical protein